MPVTVVATVTPVPEHRDAVRAALLAVVPQVHAEEGCELYALHETSDTFVVIEQWSSQELLDAHLAGEPLARMRPHLEGRLAGPTTVVLASPLPAGDDTKGRLVEGPAA